MVICSNACFWEFLPGVGFITLLSSSLYKPLFLDSHTILEKVYKELMYWELLYSWCFSRYSAPIHWLVHGHMTSNNETVSRQMPWAGNIAKTMTSNGKQFTVTRKMLTAVARDRWNLSAFFKFCFCFVLLYNKSLYDWSLGEQWIFSLESQFFPRFSGNKIHRFLWDQSLVIKC